MSKGDEAVLFVGIIDIELYSVVASDIVTDEVIITDEQVKHIEERHAGDYKRYAKYFPLMLEEPDYILRANKPKTAVILKTVTEDEVSLKLILRLVTVTDPDGRKNSIITFQKVKEKRFRRYLRNAEVLYRR